MRRINEVAEMTWKNGGGIAGANRARAERVVSALPPKADICGATANVRFVPTADIIRSVQKRAYRRRGPLPPGIPANCRASTRIRCT